jgi:hypothetical protein
MSKMLNKLQKSLPYIGLYYSLTALVFTGINLTREHSSLKYLLEDLMQLRFSVLLKADQLSLLASPVMAGILVFGVIRYFLNREENAFSLPILLGVSFFAFNTFFHLPMSLRFLFGPTPSYGVQPVWYNYILSPLAWAAMLLVFAVLISRSRSMQKGSFPDRVRRFGPTPYEKYLETIPKGLGWRRFFNYLLDLIFMWAIVFHAILLAMQTFRIEPPLGRIQPVILACLFLYFFIFEAIAGQTMGKMITQTVVQFQGKNAFGGALARTLCRFIPFEPFSFIPHKGYGWHDKISGTYVERLGDKDYTQENWEEG